jgi:putative hemolysin
MKIVTILASLVLSSVAFAMPAVNDYAQYDVSVTQGSATNQVVFEQTITAYNQAAGTYSVQGVVTQNGTSQTQVREVPASSLLSTDVVKQALSNCAQAGGQAESVTTPAGTFETCGLPLSSNGMTGKINVGLVAFGVVKSDVTYGTQHTVAVLKSQRLGK